jgi:hypothetical protein
MSCKNKNYFKCTKCTNAWELSTLYGCNESPNPVTDLEREVNVGDCVEVNEGGERFWIQVTDVCVCFLIGVVLGPLRFSHGFSVGSRIRVEIYHIYNVDRGCSGRI